MAANDEANAANPSLNSKFDEATAAVDSLYDFRDHYFGNHGLDKAINKNYDVENEMRKTLIVLDNLKDAVRSKAKYLMLKGKALNVQQEFSADAFEALSKSVKLEPSLVEAWNQLGECYWKRNAIIDAQNCFLGALAQAKNKVSLRSLSMVMRQFKENQHQNILDSVEKAKEAVQMDVKDGTSWFVLGNAYLSLFFCASGQSPTVLKQCMSAYAQAERDIIASCNPDLHYNRAIAYKYQEEYQLSLIGFARATALDPVRPEPNEKRNALIDYLSRLTDLINTKGKLKAKKLQSFASSITDNDLGPLKGSSLEQVLFNNVKEEKNKNSVICGKVVCSLTTDDPVPFTFCMIDKNEECIAVTVYNIAVGCGVKIGDTVTIPEPTLLNHAVLHNDKEFVFRNIRVDSPVNLVVNGRKLGTEKQAPTYLQCSTVSE
ncbi:tetratricopeptide repeat protein 5-like [Tubulanus polymorphus]|uniref:tetratricopeptide repeat protein 5-like n=1 Tax=Tubulanus polymorphus TaxID=672921 RepID=UPI003DA558B6